MYNVDSMLVQVPINDQKAQLVLDQPFYSVVDFAGEKSWRFFNQNEDNNLGNIDQASVFDTNSTVQVNYLELRLAKSDGTPVDETTTGLISKFLAETWLTITLNSRVKLFQIASSLLMPAPIAQAAPVTSYNTERQFSGPYKFNVPLVLQGGQNVNVSMFRDTTTNFTGLRGIMGFYTILDRRVTLK